jgi:hypothetical protein
MDGRSDTGQEPVYEVVWPLGRHVSKPAGLAPALDDLNGKTVCYLWNAAFRGDEMFPILSEELRRRFPKVRIIDQATMGDMHGLDEKQYVAKLPSLLKDHQAAAVISGVGA